MLTEDQIVQIKQQIIEQIKSAFPEDKKQESIEKINLMNPEELENFLKQNQILKKNNSTPQTECIFCSIIQKQTPSYLIDENEQAIAVLEINPISNAHCLVIPKEHFSSSEKVPEKAFALAKKISKKITSKFKPKEIKIYFQNLFGHEIINVLPIYDKENLNTERKQKNPKELKELQKELLKKERKKVVKKTIKKTIHKKKKSVKPEPKIRLPQRIP